MPSEPILSNDDRRVWSLWMAQARLRGRSQAHRRAVDIARRRTHEALAAAARWCVMVSGGKDSSALARLVSQECPGIRLASEKDDMDYPDEEDYVRALAAQCGCPVDILHPPVSPRAIIARCAAEVGAMGNWHGRAAELSRVCFYEVVEAYGAAFDGVFLGLRQAESRGRKMNRVTHGPLYRKAAGQWVSTPIVDWSDLDVYAYLDAQGVDLLPVYRCVALMHRDNPARIRKSWWLPEGNGARHGGVAWLRRYYPSLYQQLCEWMPEAAGLT